MLRNLWLIVRADGTARTTVRRPRLSWNEVAFPVRLRVPEIWGRIQPNVIEVELPEPRFVPPEVGDADAPRVVLDAEHG